MLIGDNNNINVPYRPTRGLHRIQAGNIVRCLSLLSKHYKDFFRAINTLFMLIHGEYRPRVPVHVRVI